MTDYSVVICTWNRATLLAQTLDRLVEVTVPEGVRWEVLVVDNRCTDDTAEVVSRFSEALPIRYLYEGRQGKSYACNTAVQAAEGETLLWTDDDVLVDPTWMLEYHRVIAANPDASIFGGPIVPRFLGTPPPWLEKGYPVIDNAFAALDYSREPFSLTHARYPYGANMAIRARAHALLDFDVRLGPRVNNQVRGEETELIRGLLARGETGLWVPDARVEHLIPPERQTLAFVRRYFTGVGRLLDFIDDQSAAVQLFGRPRWVWRLAVEQEVRYWLGRLLRREPDRWLASLRDASIGWGRVRGFGNSVRERDRS